MAPFTPFITERVWQDLFACDQRRAARLGAPRGVARASTTRSSTTSSRSRWRSCAGSSSSAARRVPRSERPHPPAARPRARRAPRAGTGCTPALRAEVSEELNCGELLPLGETAGRPGRRQRQGQLPRAGQALRQGHPARSPRRSPPPTPSRSLTALRVDGQRPSVVVDGEAVALTDDDVSSPRRRAPGWAVASDGGETVALDLELTPELRRAGLARETVRLVQDARKSAGFAVSDRIDAGVGGRAASWPRRCASTPAPWAARCWRPR